MVYVSFPGDGGLVVNLVYLLQLILQDADEAYHFELRGRAVGRELHELAPPTLIRIHKTDRTAYPRQLGGGLPDLRGRSSAMGARAPSLRAAGFML